jgi:hypothetical protein
MLLWCARLCNAQDAPTATVTARLSNGAYVVTICDGACIEHQALPPAKVRELLTIKAERESLAAQLQAVREQVAILEKIKATDERIAANQAKEIAELSRMLEATNGRLFEAMDLVNDYQRAAKVGRLVSVLNSPYVRVLMTLAPIAASVLAK